MRWRSQRQAWVRHRYRVDRLALMSLERQPLVALQRRESDTRAQISSYGLAEGALSSFQSAMKDLSSLEAFRKIFQSMSSTRTS